MSVLAHLPRPGPRCDIVCHPLQFAGNLKKLCKASRQFCGFLFTFDALEIYQNVLQQIKIFTHTCVCIQFCWHFAFSVDLHWRQRFILPVQFLLPISLATSTLCTHKLLLNCFSTISTFYPLLPPQPHAQPFSSIRRSLSCRLPNCDCEYTINKFVYNEIVRLFMAHKMKIATLSWLRQCGAEKFIADYAERLRQTNKQSAK